MKIKFIIFILLSFTSFNTIAEIPRESITEIRQLNKEEIIEKFSNYKASGTFDEIYEGVHYQTTFEEKYYPNQEYTVLLPEYDAMASGRWGVGWDGRICYKATDKHGRYFYGDVFEEECFYVFEGLESKYGSDKNIYTSVTNGGDFQSRVDQLEILKDEPSSNSLSDDELIDIAIANGISFDLDADGNLQSRYRDYLINYVKENPSDLMPELDLRRSNDGSLVECKKTYKHIPVRKEYAAGGTNPAVYSADRIKDVPVREQPCDKSNLIKTISGDVVFVKSKIEGTNDYWFLIKEIEWNGIEWKEEIETLGYAKAKYFCLVSEYACEYQSEDEINSMNAQISYDSNSKTYSDSPGNLLIDAYVNYVVIKKMHSMREGYAVVYINDSQMKKAKNQIIEIEKILVNEFSLDEDLLWDTAMRKYDQDYYVIDLMESTGTYTESGNRVAMLSLLSIDTIADEVIGSSSTKDF